MNGYMVEFSRRRNSLSIEHRWYEYHWPRDPASCSANRRILSPTLIRQVTFVVDDVGYLSDHACLMIQPTKKTERAWHDFEGKMNSVAGKLEPKDLLQYCLAFMNSNYAQQRLITGHRPTPKGFYAITEAYMKEIPIPVVSDKKTVKTIVDLVEGLSNDYFCLSNKEDVKKMEERIQELVDGVLAEG